MNAIAQLEQRIASVEALIAENQRRVDTEPVNVAAALQMDSTKHHLDDLQGQLQQANAAHLTLRTGNAVRETLNPCCHES